MLLRFSIIQFSGGFILVWMHQSCVIAFASCKGAVELLGSHLASETFSCMCCPLRLIAG